MATARIEVIIGHNHRKFIAFESWDGSKLRNVRVQPEINENYNTAPAFRVVPQNTKTAIETYYNRIGFSDPILFCGQTIYENIA